MQALEQYVVRMLPLRMQLGPFQALRPKLDLHAVVASFCATVPASVSRAPPVKVICRSMGYSHGSVSSSPCRFYGGADLCGAAGSPVVRFCDDLVLVVPLL